MRLFAVTFLLLAPLAACQCGHPADPDCSADPPTVVPPAAQTRAATLLVNGGKCPGQGIWVQAERWDAGQLLVPADGKETWMGAVLLTEQGDWQLSFLAERDGGGFTPAVGPFTVFLDSVPPEAPTITPPPGCFFDGYNASVTVTLQGTKAADADLWFSLDGTAAVQRASRDGQTTWSIEHALGAGRHQVAVFSQDELGNQSATRALEVCVTHGNP